MNKARSDSATKERQPRDATLLELFHPLANVKQEQMILTSITSANCKWNVSLMLRIIRGC